MAAVNGPVAVPNRTAEEIKKHHRRQFLRALAAEARWGLANVADTRDVRGDGNALVSMTTYGARVRTCHLALESIALGDVRPSRLVLWLPEADRAEVTYALRRLERRGVEIRMVRDVGPHTKYFHALAELVDGQCLVTADDDIVYPRDWLSGFLEARERSRDVLWCRRARLIVRDGEKLALYRTWPLANAESPSSTLFFTGVAGAVYPQSLVEALLERGDSFLQHCRNVDDVWINHVAQQRHISVGLVTGESEGPLASMRSQRIAISSTNVAGGGNDRALAAIAFGQTQPMI